MWIFTGIYFHSGRRYNNKMWFSELNTSVSWNGTSARPKKDEVHEYVKALCDAEGVPVFDVEFTEFGDESGDFAFIIDPTTKEYVGSLSWKKV
jgi:hypothetical protein